jgi:hypothetical protein
MLETVISCFPRTWSKSKSDPSAIHKAIRTRLKDARKDEISSAYDLALIIIDEASRVFFDRTKTNDQQPNMVDMFADAIRGVVSALNIKIIVDYQIKLEGERKKRKREKTANSPRHINKPPHLTNFLFIRTWPLENINGSETQTRPPKTTC